MLITNFTTGRDDLYVLWDGKVNKLAWPNLASVPSGPYLDLARVAKRIQVDTDSHKKLSRKLIKKTRTVK
ncbi:MAG: hypothetical protein ACO3PY_06110 [Pontimonas sp.]|jgi:hypothetical protein